MTRRYRIKRYNLGRGYFGLGFTYSHGTININFGPWVWDIWEEK